MRRRYKEVIIAICLWGLFLLSTVYVSGLLFPSQTTAAKYEMMSGLGEGAKKAIIKISQEMFPVISYILEQPSDKKDKPAVAADQSYYEYLKLGSDRYETNAAVVDNKNEGAGDALEATISETQTEAVQVPVAALPINRLERFQVMAERGGWNFNEMMQFDTLLNQLYVVSAGTSITEQELNPETLLSYDLSLAPQDGYQILIYHTHSQEAYADSVPGDVSQTVVGMGELLKECLESYGYSVLHHKGIYDLTDGKLDRDPAYTKALPVISSIIEAYPEIQVIIDLHRDGVKEDVHLVQDVNGKPTARVMYFNGLCRSETGERTDITNPYREENMAMSLQLALTTMTDYPGLTRCIYLRSSRYNLHLRGKSALIEVGAQTNTVEEVRNAIPVIADVLNKVLTN